jgi:hypothetical protein
VSGGSNKTHPIPQPIWNAPTKGNEAWAPGIMSAPPDIRPTPAVFSDGAALAGPIIAVENNEDIVIKANLVRFVLADVFMFICNEKLSQQDRTDSKDYEISSYILTEAADVLRAATHQVLRATNVFLREISRPPHHPLR